MTELSPAERAFLQGLKKSPNDFDCLTLRLQVAYFVRYLKDRGDLLFTVHDLGTLFSVAGMTAPRSGKPLRPTPGQLQKALDTLERAESPAIRRAGDAYEAV